MVLNCITAHQMLHRTAKARPGQRIARAERNRFGNIVRLSELRLVAAIIFRSLLTHPRPQWRECGRE